MKHGLSRRDDVKAELTRKNIQRTIAALEKLKRPANIFNQNHFA
jgi:hypothetical protein